MLRKTVLSLFVLSIPAASLAQDSYLCTKASLEERFTQTQKTLEDQFGTSAVDVRGIALSCTATAGSSHPNVHQLGMKMGLSKDVEQARFERSDHVVFDQFGEHPVSLVKPAGLLAPTAMVHGGGGTETIDTTGVDHFQCYKAARVSGSPKFVPPAEPLAVGDSFGNKMVTVAKISKVCAPTNVNGDDPSAPGHDGYLVCYRARLVSGVMGGIISVNSESFGAAVILLNSLTEYCVPASMDVAP